MVCSHGNLPFKQKTMELALFIYIKISAHTMHHATIISNDKVIRPSIDGYIEIAHRKQMHIIHLKFHHFGLTTILQYVAVLWSA